MIHNIQSAQISDKQDRYNRYVIMKTMCPPGYHNNKSFLATHVHVHDVRIVHLGSSLYIRTCWKSCIGNNTYSKFTTFLLTYI